MALSPKPLLLKIQKKEPNPSSFLSLPWNKPQHHKSTSLFSLFSRIGAGGYRPAVLSPEPTFCWRQFLLAGDSVLPPLFLFPFILLLCGSIVGLLWLRSPPPFTPFFCCRLCFVGGVAVVVVTRWCRWWCSSMRSVVFPLSPLGGWVGWSYLTLVSSVLLCLC